MTDFDVIVVGAGPAGSVAAYEAARRGLSVLLLDRAGFPRDKPCGGGISARVLRRFPEISSVFNSVPTHWVRKIYFESPSGRVLDHTADEPLYAMIRRVEFDDALRQRAVAAGAIFKSPELVRTAKTENGSVFCETDSGQRYAARVLIAADGANSVIARLLKLRTGPVQSTYAIDLMEETAYTDLNIADRDRMYVYYGFAGHQGYGYVFPKTSHINLGIGFKLDYYKANLDGEHYTHHANFLDFLRKKNVIHGKSVRSNFRAFPIPLSGPLQKTVSGNVLLCGDAGGFVNAFTAEGIYYAMVSGELAGKAAAAFIQQSKPLAEYETVWRKDIGEDLDKSVDIQRRAIANPAQLDKTVEMASRSHTVAELLAKYATGLLTYAEFKRAMMLKGSFALAWSKLRG